MSYIQLFIGIILYLNSPWLDKWEEIGLIAIMRDSKTSNYLVDYPVLNIIALLSITIGWSLQKHQTNHEKKFIRITLFYGLGLLLFLKTICWKFWD